MSTKRKTPTFSVGLFLLAGLSLLGWMVVKYGTTDKVQEGYDITIEFDDASGIIEGGVVRLSGANVGHITSAPKLNANHKVEVPVTLSEDLKLPLDTRFEIVSLSLLGDKAVYIKIPENEGPPYLKQGDKVTGFSPKGLSGVQDQAEKLSAEISELLEKTDLTFKNLNLTLLEYRGVANKLNVSLERLNNSLLSDDGLANIQATIQNVNSSAEGLADFSKDLKPLSQETRAAILEFQNVAKNSNVVVNKINQRIERIDPILETLPQTITTYNKVGKSLEKSLNNKDGLLGAITSDKEVTNDAKTFVKNLRTNGVLGYKDDSNPNKEDPRDRYRGLRR